MSTPRKRWFKVADAWIRSEWDDATLATVARLMAWLNQRYARDAIPATEAGNARLFQEDAMAISRARSSTRRCFETLIFRLKQADLETLTYQLVLKGRHSYLEISWPKFPEFQEYGSRSPGKSPGNQRPAEGAYPPPPPPPPLEEITTSEESAGAAPAEPPAASKKRRSASKQTPPPEDLSNDEKRQLVEWAERREPWAVPRMRALVDDMLQFHRSKGLECASWYVAAQRWITNERVKFGRDKLPAARNGGYRRGDVIDAARELAEEWGLRDAGAPADDHEAFFDVSAEPAREHKGVDLGMDRGDAGHSRADSEPCTEAVDGQGGAEVPAEPGGDSAGGGEGGAGVPAAQHPRIRAWVQPEPRRGREDSRGLAFDFDAAAQRAAGSVTSTRATR